MRARTALLASAATLGLCAPPSPAFARTYAYTATIAARFETPRTVVAAGVRWRCTASRCEALLETATPTIAGCAALARQIGPIVSYASELRPLDGAALRDCNARAGAGGGPGLGSDEVDTDKYTPADRPAPTIRTHALRLEGARGKLPPPAAPIAIRTPALRLIGTMAKARPPEASRPLVIRTAALRVAGEPAPGTIRTGTLRLAGAADSLSPPTASPIAFSVRTAPLQLAGSRDSVAPPATAAPIVIRTGPLVLTAEPQNFYRTVPLRLTGSRDKIVPPPAFKPVEIRTGPLRLSSASGSIVPPAPFKPVIIRTAPLTLSSHRQEKQR